MRGILYIFLLCGILLTSCADNGSEIVSEPIYTPRYAKGFAIVRNKATGERLLRITNPWQGAKDITLYTPIAQPPQRIVAMSSSYVAMIDALGCADRIVGVSGAQFISTKSVVERIGEGKVFDIGFDGTFDFERLVALKSDMVLLYGVASGESAISNKLDDLSIPYIYIGDYLEAEPLGKAEWVVAFGYLCGKEEESKRLFDGIEERYLSIRNRAHSKSLRPRVMLNTPYRDTWFMPSTESYMVRLIEDANGEYIYTENHSTSSKPISLEEALLLAERADYWFNVGHYRSLDGLRVAAPHFAHIAAIEKRRVYNNTRRNTPNGGSDFWESGAIQPDVILADLVKILHNENSDEELYYYEQLQ